MKTKTFKLFTAVVIIAIIIVFVFALINRESITKHNGESILQTKDSLIREIEKARNGNAERMAGIADKKKREKESMLQGALPKKMIYRRNRSETNNYLIIDIANHECDLSINEMQNLYNSGWELVAASDRRFEDKRYVFKKIEGGKK